MVGGGCDMNTDCPSDVIWLRMDMSVLVDYYTMLRSVRSGCAALTALRLCGSSHTSAEGILLSLSEHILRMHHGQQGGASRHLRLFYSWRWL